MNRNGSLQKNTYQTTLCILLSAAIVLGLILPGGEMIHTQPDNPLGDGAIRDITILQVGEDAQNMDNIVVPNQDSAAPSEPDEDGSGDEQSEETQPGEAEPEETEPQVTRPQEPEVTEPDRGEDDEGNDDGDEGEEGGDPLALDLAAVLTWYKYGNDPNHIACGPSSTVYKSINTAQLRDNTLQYEFSLTGEDAKYVEITKVSVSAGDSAFRDTGRSGSQKIELPGGNGDRNYTFLVSAVIEKKNEEGEKIRQELTFTFVLKCEFNLDLDLELTWHPNEGNIRKLLCGPDKTESFVVRNYDLTERIFGYSVKLTGSLAADARIIQAAYTTGSGLKSGDLSLDSGTLILDPAPGADQEVYNLTFTVRTPDRDVLYSFKLTYQEKLDVQLKFHWMEKGVTQRTRTCEPGEPATVRILRNQLSAGAIPYEMELVGDDGENGKILSVIYTSEAGGAGELESSGALTLSMPEGASTNTYQLTVTAMVSGQRVNFVIVIQYSSDVSVQMEFTVREEGLDVTRVITCENARTKTAEPVYDDQLTDGVLQYTMKLIGAEGENVTVTSVTCFQSGSGRTVTLGAQGQLALLLKEGKTGENTFEIEAQDSAGSIYHFTINIPYKHRGENNIKILTNLVNGQEIINETKTNLTVRAWSEDENGNVISYIPANGTDTRLIVMLDGEVLSYVSSSGAASEYDLYPANPEVGDTNEHVLSIYAEDAFGNYGELELKLIGQRRESGQQIGTATIYVDMTVLGLGVVANMNYKVLADEPVSYVIAKAIMGMDTGEPYGSAEQTLGWTGRYAGTLDNGFYLQSLTTGHTANALEGGTWPGSTEEEVLAAIDARFGAGTNLATLWRCIYRNGLNKSTGSGNSFGEFDYTSGSGWVYSIGGTYYPGQGMQSVYLQDGDVLTLRFTLAYGWDIGSGTAGYGSTVGYCVSALNGSFRVNHRMETITGEDGSVSHVCRCCGVVADCAHENTLFVDLEDGTHIQYCNDCGRELGDPADHGWTYTGENGETHHSCEACGATEAHNWREVEGSNTATCTQPGVHSIQCVICNHIREEETGPSGHSLDNQWQVTAEEHYEKCSACGEIANRSRHQYEHIIYWENGVEKEDYECRICHCLHIDECDGTLVEKEATCQKITWVCLDCEHEMDKEGLFEEHHHYADGSCIHCGTPDPEGGSGEPPETQPGEPTEPEPSEPTPTGPPPEPELPPDPSGDGADTVAVLSNSKKMEEAT